MNRVAIIVILAAASLLSGCRSATDKVRNGYLKYNETTTIGQALEHTFSNGTWKSFTTEKGVTIVEFDASEPFSKFRGGPDAPYLMGCYGSCLVLDQKLTAYCRSAEGRAPYVKDYQAKRDNLEAKIAAVDKEKDALSNAGVQNDRYNELEQQETELRNQRFASINDTPESFCYINAVQQHANDPIPIVVQFSINQDGTFQYAANNMSWSEETLFSLMYN